MTSEEEKDFAEKIIRLRPKCCAELGISQDELTVNGFVKWLVDRISKYEEKSDETTNSNIII